MSYHHLSFEQRTALMLESTKPDFSARAFAKQINRHHSTIYRELSRNTRDTGYSAQSALDAAIAGRRRGHRKLKPESVLWQFIVKALQCLWSPEQISNRLKTFTELTEPMNIGHTTIYANHIVTGKQIGRAHV